MLSLTVKLRHSIRTVVQVTASIASLLPDGCLRILFERLWLRLPMCAQDIVNTFLESSPDTSLPLINAVQSSWKGPVLLLLASAHWDSIKPRAFRAIVLVLTDTLAFYSSGTKSRVDILLSFFRTQLSCVDLWLDFGHYLCTLNSLPCRTSGFQSIDEHSSTACILPDLICVGTHILKEIFSISAEARCRILITLITNASNSPHSVVLFGTLREITSTFVYELVESADIVFPVILKELWFLPAEHVFELISYLQCPIIQSDYVCLCAFDYAQKLLTHPAKRLEGLCMYAALLPCTNAQSLQPEKLSTIIANAVQDPTLPFNSLRTLYRVFLRIVHTFDFDAVKMGVSVILAPTEACVLRFAKCLEWLRPNGSATVIRSLQDFHSKSVKLCKVRLDLSKCTHQSSGRTIEDLALLIKFLTAALSLFCSDDNYDFLTSILQSGLQGLIVQLCDKEELRKVLRPSTRYSEHTAHSFLLPCCMALFEYDTLFCGSEHHMQLLESCTYLTALTTGEQLDFTVEPLIFLPLLKPLLKLTERVIPALANMDCPYPFRLKAMRLITSMLLRIVQHDCTIDPISAATLHESTVSTCFFLDRAINFCCTEKCKPSEDFPLLQRMDADCLRILTLIPQALRSPELRKFLNSCPSNTNSVWELPHWADAFAIQLGKGDSEHRSMITAKIKLIWALAAPSLLRPQDRTQQLHAGESLPLLSAVNSVFLYRMKKTILPPRALETALVFVLLFNSVSAQDILQSSLWHGAKVGEHHKNLTRYVHRGYALNRPTRSRLVSGVLLYAILCLNSFRLEEYRSFYGLNKSIITCIVGYFVPILRKHDTFTPFTIARLIRTSSLFISTCSKICKHLLVAHIIPWEETEPVVEQEKRLVSSLQWPLSLGSAFADDIITWVDVNGQADIRGISLLRSHCEKLQEQLSTLLEFTFLPSSEPAVVDTSEEDPKPSPKKKSRKKRSQKRSRNEVVDFLINQHPSDVEGSDAFEDLEDWFAVSDDEAT